jgi:uncharacterized membrane protein YkoI
MGVMWCGLLLYMLCAAPADAATFEDADNARAALARGEILPLADILARVEAQFDSRMIEVEFDVEDGRYLYEFELISRDGVIREVMVDGATGEVLGIEIEQD